MADCYGEVFAEMVDRVAKYTDRPDIFRLLEISRHQYYNVTNPNRTTSGGNPYPFPTEWGVRATREFKDFSWIKVVARDCGCICLTGEEAEKLQEVYVVFQKVLGMVKK
jgi:hypothetical protein